MRDPEKATSLCNVCPKLCRFSCPVADADQNESTTPWGKMSTMKKVDDRELPMTAETMGLAYKCLNCRSSQSVCELDNPVSSALDTYRVRAFRAGLAPAGIYEYCNRFRQYDNPYGKDLLKELIKLFPEKIRSKKRAVYFPGCTETAGDPAAIADTLELLGKLGGREVGLYPEPIQCCGYPLFVAGDWDNFVQLAEINSQLLKDTRLVLSGAPACLYTMETLYRSAGTPASAKFMHITEYVVPSAFRLRALPRVSASGYPRSVAYHDPCYLGRYRKVYEEPRELIRRITGRPPKEFIRNRESSYCCGAGGLLPVSSPDTARKITENRLEEFQKTEAGLLVSSCPTCVNRFKKYGKGVRVKNLVEFLKDGFLLSK